MNIDEQCQLCGHEIDSYGCTFLSCDSNTGIADLQGQVENLKAELQVAGKKLLDLQVENAEREAEVMGLVAENDFLKAEIARMQARFVTGET